MQIQVIKKDISDMCHQYAHQQMLIRRITKKDLVSSKRWVYREFYRMLYSEFDRIMATVLSRQNKSLEDYDLRYASNQNNTEAYIDRIANAGFITSLQAVAQALFGQN